MKLSKLEICCTKQYWEIWWGWKCLMSFEYRKVIKWVQTTFSKK